jgi:hypothetical protein
MADRQNDGVGGERSPAGEMDDPSAIRAASNASCLVE